MSWVSKNSLIARRRFRLWAVGAIAAALFYPALLMLLGDQRFADGSLAWGEANWLEIAIAMHGVLLLLALWMSVIAHAWDAKRWWWAFFALVAWPVAFVYAFRFGEREGGAQPHNNGLHRTAASRNEG